MDNAIDTVSNIAVNPPLTTANPSLLNTEVNAVNPPLTTEKPISLIIEETAVNPSLATANHVCIGCNIGFPLDEYYLIHVHCCR